MTQQEQKIMEMLINSNQRQTRAIVTNFLKKNYEKVTVTKDYIVAKGEIPIALVAHMDTVFDISISKIGRDLFYDERRNVMFCPYGAGFDDKAGIFAIIQLIRKGLRPHVIFTTDEESGAIGAMRLAKLSCPFTELKYVIQLDRRGSNDCVFYNCDNQDFVSYVEKFGFSFNHGSFTDISELCPAWKVAGVNLSVGYYNEHTESEILYVEQLFATMEKVQQMLKVANEAPKFVYIPSINSFDTNWYLPWAGSSHQVIECVACHKHFMEEELFPTIMADRTTKFFCPDCMVNRVSWCHKCQNAYELTGVDNGICHLCREEGNKSGAN